MCKYAVSKELECSSSHFEKEELGVGEPAGTTAKPAKLEFSFPNVSLSQFLDPNENWVLVENGSYLNFFDALPKSFRIGPWNIFNCVYLAAIVYWIVWNCIECYVNPPQHPEYTYYDVDTWQWKFTAVACAWTLYICYEVTKTDLGWYSWMSYTMQSWTLITVRYTLSTLAPFFPSLARWSEYLRFPMVLQTMIVFTVWNFALMPGIYSQLKTEQNRKDFYNWCFNFLLTNLHFLNLPLAAVSAIWGSPSRELTKIDFCIALFCSLQYLIFYLLVCDRLGMHFYFIFSPRSPLALITWSSVLGCLYGGFFLWKGLLLAFGA